MSARAILDEMLMRQSKPGLVGAAMQAVIRPVNASALDIDLHSADERGRPLADARWTVARFQWTGQKWRRWRRLGGPMHFEVALRELEFHMKRTGLPRIADA